MNLGRCWRETDDVILLLYEARVNVCSYTSVTMDVQSDGQESVSVTFEWTLRGLKNLFDSTKGDTKSKVTKSAKFGDGRWQVRSSLSC